MFIPDLLHILIWATSNTADALSVSGGTGHFQFTKGYGDFSSGDVNDYGYFWKRAAGFFDVVTYHGHVYKRPSENFSDVPHNLGVVPEMIWIQVEPQQFYKFKVDCLS